ncbi:hypothetical protein DBV05_g9797 [Lasiodiplodia theobromae]|uniref:Uncharacterized protein n=1 Tax=Lasiodiplodia theobromae TaxID=45133 RepID=A0A5N5D2B7_9PEZI|nr:hypothetical protein DBV05_g9797 [Lasiodiplodia theobromae]
MFPPPPPLPPKPQDYSVHPPPLPPRPGTQGPPTDQSSAWSRPQVQTVQSTPSFQSPPPTAHHIYRKYGHVLQDASGTPTNAFQPPSALQNQTPTAPLPPPPPQQAWQQHNQGNYQNIYTTTPQQQTWQAPAAHQQTPVSPVQHDQQLYATTHTPVNQSYPPPPQVFQSPAQQTPLKVPSVSPPPYNWAQPPPMQPGPAPSDYFQHSTTPQPYFQRPPSLGNNPYQRPASLGNNPYNPPVSPPIPTVSPLVSRQGSVNSQQGARDRHDTVSSISTTAAHERHDTFSTVSTLGERPATPKAEPQSEAVGGVSGQRIQPTGAGATTAAGTSASALGFGGPGGWEYYDAPGEEDEEEEEVAVGKSEAKDQFKAVEHDPVSPVELPSDPAPFAMKPPAAAETKSDDAGENAIFELPADFVMEPSVKPEVSADQSKEGMAGQDATIVLPKPSTRYNRIPRPQDLIPDLGPWYASSLERFISMLKTEAHAASDEQRAAAFMEFVATESKLRGIPYYTQPPGDDVQRSVNNGEKRPKLPLEIPPSDAATEMEIQYSPGGRPVWRPKLKDRQNSDEAKTTVPGENQQQAYKPFRQGQSTTDGEGSSQPAVPTPTGLPSEQTGPATAIQQAQYKPYTPSTPAAEAIRRDSLPRRDSFPRSDSFPHRSSVSSPIRQEHTETFFPAPLALHSKKDQATSSSSSSSTPKPVPSITAPPPDEVSTPETSLPYPTTPSHTPPPPQPPALGTKPTLSSLTPAPLALSTVAPPPPPPTGAARLRALLANFKPSSSSAETTTQIVTTLSALPPLDATKAHIAGLNASFDGSSPPAAPAARQARVLYDELAAERGEQQVLNDMAFEANEITYPQLLGRDEALKKEDAEKVAARAAGLMDAAGKRYRAWEEAVFAGVYGRVREEVGAGVEGLAVVEDVGAEAVKALEGEEEHQQAPVAAAPGSGLVKINARTGEVITVDGLGSATAAAKPSHPDPAAPTSSAAAANVAQTLSALTTLTTSARALLTLHAHISARHALLAATVADRDARYAAAETAPLEFLVAFDECENPHSTTASSGKKAAAADKKEGDDAGDAADADADARKKLLDLRKHFTAARLGAAARAAADEEVRARQTWQRVEGWMAAGLAAVAKAVEAVGAAARQVEANDDPDGGVGVGGLLDRAEAVVGELARRVQELVRCFHEAEVLLNEAEFAVSVEEARAAVFEKAVARGDGPAGWGGWEEEARVVVGKLEEERRNEDGVLKEELESRLRVIDTEQKAKAMEVVRRVRKRVVGREEFGDEDRIVGWVS